MENVRPSLRQVSAFDSQVVVFVSVRHFPIKMLTFCQLNGLLGRLVFLINI